MVRLHASLTLWRSVRALPEFGRLLVVRIFSQFGDGLFAAGLAGGLLFNPERAAGPWEMAAAFAVLFMPYSLIGPFAGALLDRWDRRYVLVGANSVRFLLVLGVGLALVTGNGDQVVLFGALIVNGATRFVASGLSAALPHVVPREQVVTMNSVATACGAVCTFLGANFMLLGRYFFGGDDKGSATIIFMVAVPVLVAAVLSARFTPRSLGPDDTARAIHGSAVYAVSTGLAHGLRTVASTPSVAATLTGLAAHRAVFGINTLLLLVIVRHTDTPAIAVAGLGTAVLFVAATGSAQFLSTLVTPALVRRLGRFAASNWSLGVAAVVQLVGVGLHIPVMLGCAFLLGAAGQVVKLCVDSAMQIDVPDPLRGHVFAVQDSVFWVSFIVAVTLSAAVIPDDGRSTALALAGVGVYLVGLLTHTLLGRRTRGETKVPADD